jgi:hypothetical protein
MDEFGIRFLYPAPQSGVDLIGINADGNRDGDVLGDEKGKLVFPIQTSRRDRRVREPVEGDVAEDVVSRKALGLAPAKTRAMSASLASSWSRIQAAKPTGESASPYSVCGRFAISMA